MGGWGEELTELGGCNGRDEEREGVEGEEANSTEDEVPGQVRLGSSIDRRSLGEQGQKNRVASTLEQVACKVLRGTTGSGDKQPGGNLGWQEDPEGSGM